MNVLSIDTATEVFGLGLLLADGRWFDMRQNAGFKHAEIAMATVDRTLLEAGISVAEIDLVVCSRGPGSFTGLRIGMATAKGISAGLGIPLVSVTSLDAMAARVSWFDGVVLPVIDARKKRVYTAAYLDGIRSGELLDVTFDELAKILTGHSRVLLTGPAAAMAGEVIGVPSGCLIDTQNTGGWSREYVDIGIKEFAASGPASPDSGPEYVRKSDAELNLELRDGR